MIARPTKCQALGWFAAVASLLAVACSSGGSSPAGTGGGGGASATGGGAGTGTGGGSAGGGGAAGGFVNAGQCGERGMATANTTAYDGTSEFFIVGDAGQGVDVCAVRFDVKRVAAAAAGCPSCNWAHTVEFTNPMVITNVNGACDASDSVPPLDAAGRAQMTNARVGRGFSLTTGHGDALLKYSDAMAMWIGVGTANWDQASGDFFYNINTGNCMYGR